MYDMLQLLGMQVSSLLPIIFVDIIRINHAFLYVCVIMTKYDVTNRDIQIPTEHPNPVGHIILTASKRVQRPRSYRSPLVMDSSCYGLHSNCIVVTYFEKPGIIRLKNNFHSLRQLCTVGGLTTPGIKFKGHSRFHYDNLMLMNSSHSSLSSL